MVTVSILQFNQWNFIWPKDWNNFNALQRSLTLNILIHLWHREKIRNTLEQINREIDLIQKMSQKANKKLTSYWAVLVCICNGNAVVLIVKLLSSLAGSSTRFQKLQPGQFYLSKLYIRVIPRLQKCWKMIPAIGLQKVARKRSGSWRKRQNWHKKCTAGQVIDRIRKAFGIAYCYKMKKENELNVLNLRLDETFRTFVDLGNINITLTTVRRSNFIFLSVRDNCLKSPIRCNEQSINAVFRKMEHWLKGP